MSSKSEEHDTTKQKLVERFLSIAPQCVRNRFLKDNSREQSYCQQVPANHFAGSQDDMSYDERYPIIDYKGRRFKKDSREWLHKSWRSRHKKSQKKPDDNGANVGRHYNLKESDSMVSPGKKICRYEKSDTSEVYNVGIPLKRQEGHHFKTTILHSSRSSSGEELDDEIAEIIRKSRDPSMPTDNFYLDFPSDLNNGNTMEDNLNNRSEWGNGHRTISPLCDSPSCRMCAEQNFWCGPSPPSTPPGSPWDDELSLSEKSADLRQFYEESKTYLNNNTRRFSESEED